ncbi:MAG TPA: hypothetical protein VGP73_09710 [Thermoanaerobaculia bacterium]
MLVELSAVFFAEMMTSAFAGPYGVVQQSVGTKGWLLQWLPQGGELGQRLLFEAAEAGLAALAEGAFFAGGLCPSAAKGAAANKATRIAASFQKSDAFILSLIIISSRGGILPPVATAAPGIFASGIQWDGGEDYRTLPERGHRIEPGPRPEAAAGPLDERI